MYLFEGHTFGGRDGHLLKVYQLYVTRWVRQSKFAFQLYLHAHMQKDYSSNSEQGPAFPK